MKGAGLAIGALAVALGASTTSAQEVVKKGDHPKHTFQKELLNGEGVKSLEDLQGRPVYVEFWGWH